MTLSHPETKEVSVTKPEWKQSPYSLKDPCFWDEPEAQQGRMYELTGEISEPHRGAQNVSEHIRSTPLCVVSLPDI